MYGDEELTAVDSERQQRAVGRLMEYIEKAQTYQARQPTVESPFMHATKENGGIWWREIGDLALAASFDNLQAFCTLLRGPIPRWAGYVVLRGSAEAAAAAWWLFDADVPEAIRVQRGFEERLHGIHAQRGLLEDRTRLDQQKAELAKEAATFGLAEISDSRSKGLTHFGTQRPAIQDLLAGMLPDRSSGSRITLGERLWRVLSAFAHSELWPNFIGTGEIENDGQRRSLTVHIPVLMRYTGFTVIAHDRAFARRMKLAGYPEWERERGPFPSF